MRNAQAMKMCYIIGLLVIASCQRQIRSDALDFVVTKRGLTGAPLGSPYSQFFEIIPHDRVNKSPHGALTLFLRDQPLITLSDKRGGTESIVRMIELHSPVFHLENNIRVGSSITQLQEAFPSLILHQSTTGVGGIDEYFVPAELQTSESRDPGSIAFLIDVARTTGGHLGRNYVLDGLTNRTKDFATDGQVTNMRIYYWN